MSVTAFLESRRAPSGDASVSWFVKHGAHVFRVHPDTLPANAVDNMKVSFDPKFHANGAAAVVWIADPATASGSELRAKRERHGGFNINAKPFCPASVRSSTESRDAVVWIADPATASGSQLRAKRERHGGYNINAKPFCPASVRSSTESRDQPAHVSTLNETSLEMQSCAPKQKAEAWHFPEPSLVRLREQVEFYLSPDTLAKDAFMQSKMDSTGAVPLDVILTCNKIKAITQDVEVLIHALSTSSLLQVDESRQTVRPVALIPKLSDDVSHEWEIKAKALDDRMKEKRSQYLAQKARNHQEAAEKRATYLARRARNHEEADARHATNRANYLAQRDRNHQEAAKRRRQEEALNHGEAYDDDSDDSELFRGGTIYHDENGHAMYGHYVPGRGYVPF